MAMINADVLHGLSIEKADCYGKPNLGVIGRGSKYRLASWSCVICGNRATNCHHIVGRRKYTLRTQNGVWVLESPLMAVCGSGTTGCHGRIHQRRINVTWQWDRPEFQEAWFNGSIPKEIGPCSRELYDLGCWLIEGLDTGMREEARA